MRCDASGLTGLEPLRVKGRGTGSRSNSERASSASHRADDPWTAHDVGFAEGSWLDKEEGSVLASSGDHWRDDPYKDDGVGSARSEYC